MAKLVSGRVEEYVVKVQAVNWLMVKMARGEITVVQSWRKNVVEVYAARTGKWVC